MKLFRITIKTKGGSIKTLIEAENFTYASQIAQIQFGENLMDVDPAPYLDLDKVKNIIEASLQQ